MSLFNEIVKVYPELSNGDNFNLNSVIVLRNDSDGYGDYIEKWEYHKPIPEGMKLGK